MLDPPVAAALTQVRARIDKLLGSELRSFEEVCQRYAKGGQCAEVLAFTEHELRIIRFALNRALEDR